MGGQGCACRGHGYGPRVVCCVCHGVPSQVVPEGVGEWWLGAAGAAVRARRWKSGFPPRGQWVRQCAAPRKTQCSGLQGKAVCGSRWRTQRGHSVAGGWRHLWTEGGVGEWGLVARACWFVCVRGRCSAWWMVCRRGGGPVLDGMSRGRFSRLVEREFEEVHLVRLGQGGCMLQVFVGAVYELLRCLGNGCPLHVRCGRPGVFRVGA